MKKSLFLLLAAVTSPLFSAQIDPTPFNENTRELELLALEMSEKRGITPQQLLTEYHQRNTPTMEAIRKLKKEYAADIMKVKNSLVNAKKMVRIKLEEEKNQEKIQYMHRMESFKLFREEYSGNIYAQDEIKSLKQKATELEIKHAEYVMNHKRILESLDNDFFIPSNETVDEDTVNFFSINVEILKKLKEEHQILVTEEEKFINEYLETIKLAKEKFILNQHNLIKRLIETKTLDLVD